jgi:hypothetical protein
LAVTAAEHSDRLIGLIAASQVHGQQAECDQVRDAVGSRGAQILEVWIRHAERIACRAGAVDDQDAVWRATPGSGDSSRPGSS